LTEGETKTCTVCNTEKPVSNFYMRANGSIEPVCRPCRTTSEQVRLNASPRAYLRGLLNKARYGAKKRNLAFEVTIDDIVEVWEKQGGICALSGVRMTYAKDGKGRKEMNVSLDRIDPDVGYVRRPMNVQLVCWRINLMKHTLPEHELHWWIQNVAEAMRK